MPDMLHARTEPGVVEWQGKLLVAKGYAGVDSDGVSFEEACGPLAGRWEAIAPLHCARGHPSLVVYNGCLMCFGVSDEHAILSPDPYNPTHKSWRVIDEENLCDDYMTVATLPYRSVLAHLK